MKKRIFITLFVLTSIIFGSTIDAQNRIAFVNTLEIINSLPDKISADVAVATVSVIVVSTILGLLDEPGTLPT